MLVQLDGGIVHILTMLNDVAHFTVIKREVAHCDKKVGHPGLYYHGLADVKTDLYFTMQVHTVL